MYLPHAISLPLILDVSDHSSSDDNLFDAHEWQLQTQSVFEDPKPLNRAYSLPQTALTSYTTYTNDTNICFPRNEEQCTHFSIPSINEMDESLASLPPLPIAKKQNHALAPLEETVDPLLNYINQLYIDEKQTFMICCDSILEECRSLNRIISCLNFYGRIMTNINTKHRNDIITEYFSTYNTAFLDDYYHILSQHLNGTQLYNDTNFELIYNKCCKYAPCNIQHHTTNHLNSDDKQAQFYMNLLHDIHVLFIHSYDTGFRLKRYQIQETENELFYNDNDLQHIHSILAKKREQWLSAKGEQFREMNKFNHTFTKQSIYTDTNESRNDLQINTKCFYWDYYKKNGSRWYIEQKYKSLKHEMLDHIECKLTLKQFDASYHKAMCYMNTIYAKNRLGTCNQKRIYIFDEHGDCERLHYDIDEEDAISVEHMLSVIFYTDYMELAHYFRKHFMFDTTQNIEEYKENMSEYWHWSKLMIECVEIYGEWVDDGAFYAGIDYPLVFEPVNEEWNGALSVTRQLSVCWMYCDPNGYILELSADNAPKSWQVKLLNASFLSSFGYEAEFISVGGCISGKLLNIASIRSITSKQNYAVFIRAIHMVYIALNGKYLNYRATKTDCMIIKRLMAHKLGMRYNKYPTYINRLFAFMINNRKYIKLNAKHLSAMKLKNYFMENIVFNAHNHCDVVSLEKLTKLCTFCHKINVEMDDKRNVISQDVWNALVSKMYAIENSNVDCIKMQNVANYDKYSLNCLSKLGWDLRVERDKECSQYQYELTKRHNDVVMKFKTLLISR